MEGNNKQCIQNSPKYVCMSIIAVVKSKPLNMEAKLELDTLFSKLVTPLVMMPHYFVIYSTHSGHRCSFR